MLGKFRNALYNAISIEGEGGESSTAESVPRSRRTPSKYPYQRPVFLSLFSQDEIQVSGDHLVRPILVPRELGALPWSSGYAETINAGKSSHNEDQGSFHRGILKSEDSGSLPYVYFGMFDGHAGSGVSVAAANELHDVIHGKLLRVLGHLIPEKEDTLNGTASPFPTERDISPESLIIGALESAFWEMDLKIGENKKIYRMLGGCTVLVSLFILGKLYVANAGDSRAVLCRKGHPYPMSFDFTPVTERQRLQQLGFQKPHLLGSEYTHLDFCRRPMTKDLGKNMLYRDAHMTGWTYKQISQQDLKFPVVYGEGKRSRLLATIGVTRGFGDHDLRAQSQHRGEIYIKPFLTPQPEVRVLDVCGEETKVDENDLLIMGTDGLWDVVTNERVAEIVANGVKSTNDNDEDKMKYKYISIAQELVMAARGKFVDCSWKKSDYTPATIDDISVFVIPILGYKREYEEWISQKAFFKTEESESAAVFPDDEPVK